MSLSSKTNTVNLSMYSLPPELVSRILSELPLTDAGVRTLVRCSMTEHGTLRGVALDPALWRPYYKHRYPHSEHLIEAERRDKLKDDWMQMYRERRRLDCEAMENLKAIESCDPRARIEHARRIASLGLDVWDALAEEAHGPPPTLFQQNEDIQKVMDGSPLTNLTRKYWASELLKIIARRNAIDWWNAMNRSITGENLGALQFEEAYASLSSFYDVLPDEVLGHVDREAEGCKRYLEDEKISYIPELEGFNAKSLCIAVCQYMRLQGFGIGDGTIPSVDARFTMWLPHVFMTSARRTVIPALLFVFIGILKRLGIATNPWVTRQRVGVAIGDQLVDVISILQNADPDALGAFEYVQDTHILRNQAKHMGTILCWAARGILSASSEDYAVGGLRVLTAKDDYMKRLSRYMAETVQSILFRNAPRALAGTHTVSVLDSGLFPLDLELVLRDKGVLHAPDLAHGRSEEEDGVDEIVLLASDLDISSLVSTLFVGQIVKVANSDLRCIVGWKEKDGRITCSTLHRYLCGVRHPPVEAIIHSLYWPQDLARFLENPMLGQFFEDGEFLETNASTGIGRGRFIMNKHMKKLYPDDDARGARWIREEM